LAEAGAKVVLGARRTDRLEALKKEIEAAGGIAAYKETDVVSRDQVVALIKTANDTFVPPFAFVLFICQTLVLFTLLSLSTCLVVGTTCMQVDILVNNAGVMLLSPIDALLQDEWERMLDVNVKVCARSPHCSCRLARDLTHKCVCVCVFVQGVLNGVAAVLPGMTERGKGDIVNISSGAFLLLCMRVQRVVISTVITCRCWPQALPHRRHLLRLEVGC
jgi:NADP-dependent 3-hydroxy acid dehydrogenase YdfG